MTQEQMQAEMNELINEVIERDSLGKVKESAAFKDLEAKLREVRQMMDEQRAESQPRQMLNVNDVMEILGVSKSQGYKIIKKLNNELSKNNYIVVRGKISKAYFEKRVFGIDVD